MPVNCHLKLRNVTQSEFDKRDVIVMRCAYAAQNALGRLCDERVYEADLARRLRAEGFKSVEKQVPVLVTHDGFVKEYRLDLVADDVIYELKTTSAFVPQHEAQALNYAMLMDVNHVKLLNFRTNKVQGKLLFNAYLNIDRQNVRWDDNEWRPLSPYCEGLRLRTRELMKDWGACLEVSLYDEAMVYFFGGEAKCLQRVPVIYDGTQLGSHLIRSHADGLCFLITAFTTGLDAQQRHIYRLLELTGLRGIQWINLNRTIVSLRTVQLRTAKIN